MPSSRRAFFKGGRWRDSKGRFARKPTRRRGARKRVLPPIPPAKRLWRITLTINYVTHHRYYAVRLQRWATSEEQLRDREYDLEQKLIKELESHLGYKREEWWFPHQIGVGYQEVVYQRWLVGREEVQHEFLRVK